MPTNTVLKFFRMNFRNLLTAGAFLSFVSMGFTPALADSASDAQTEPAYVYTPDTLSAEYRPAVKRFLARLKSGNKAAIAEHVTYPLRRDAPLPYIKNKTEFVSEFDEILDANLIRDLLGSNVLTDWSAMGQGIMAWQGSVWIEYDGDLLAVNARTEAGEKHRRQLLAAKKAALYPTLRTFVEPMLEWRTAKFRIRVDQLGEYDNYRYAVWPADGSTSDKPDLVITGGKVEYEGSGGNHTYTFKKGIYRYECSVNVVGPDDMTPGDLYVYKNGRRIVEQTVLKDLLH